MSRSMAKGKRGVLIHVSPELSRRLRQLALDEDTTLQALGLEAPARDSGAVTGSNTLAC